MNAHTPPSISDGIDLAKEGIFTVEVIRRGKKYPLMLGPNDIITSSRRITGKERRKKVADYLVKRDGNRCALSTPGVCIMGGSYFANPEKANFDHIVLSDPPDQRLRNLRLTCDPCNKHQLAVQWKSYRGMASVKVRKRKRKMGLRDSTADIPVVVDINLRAYPVFCRWLRDEISQKEQVTTRHAINAGAKFTRKKTGNGSPQSARNWLDMETSEEGEYEIVEGMVRKREKPDLRVREHIEKA